MLENLTVLLHDIISGVLPPIISIIEIVGIFVVSVGSFKAFYHYMVSMVTRKENHLIKYDLANSMATGLEFKMAAEILKTVLIRTQEELFILGAIIILRALLSFMIHVEMKATKNHGSNDGEATTH